MVTQPLPSPLLLNIHASTTKPIKNNAASRWLGPLHLNLRHGERVAILGPSGAGKSTLLKLIAGDLVGHTSDIVLKGTPLPAMTAAVLAQTRAVLPQNHTVAFGLQVELVVRLGRVARQQDPQLASIVASALTLACADHLKGRRMDSLSGGEQARVQLARVFAQLWDVQEGLLLVDEPLAALDPGLQFELMDAMLSFAKKRKHALIAVLHDINQALDSFDRLWLIRQGQLVGDHIVGPDAIAPLSQLYGIDLHVVDAPDRALTVIPSRSLSKKHLTRSA